jgi:predicted dehydrogenase
LILRDETSANELHLEETMGARLNSIRLDQVNVGVVGAAGRGASFRAAFDAHPATRIHAVCDVNEQALGEAARRLGATETYVDYEEMLERSDIDAVVIGTPMQFHAPQAIAALERDIHVLSEVTAAVSIDECMALVAARSRSQAVYMMAENYTYIKSNVLVVELVRRGLFGEVYYAEGEYLHELKELNEITRWRRRWQTGIDGITYGTHSLGPILQWMPGDRVVRICCAGSGHHYLDPRGDAYENQDTCVMLAQTARGALIKIRVDMLSERPHAMTNYSLQGTRGCYESARSPEERHKIWLADLCPDKNVWMDLAELEHEYMPDMWRNPPEAALRAGHGGGDYFEVLDFVRSIVDGAPCPIGIHEAMDMTLPGLVSQASIAAGGAWMDVPDSRAWL